MNHFDVKLSRRKTKHFSGFHTKYQIAVNIEEFYRERLTLKVKSSLTLVGKLEIKA
jgi:hypothetical protein